MNRQRWTRRRKARSGRGRRRCPGLAQNLRLFAHDVRREDCSVAALWLAHPHADRWRPEQKHIPTCDLLNNGAPVKILGRFVVRPHGAHLHGAEDFDRRLLFLYRTLRVLSWDSVLPCRLQLAYIRVRYRHGEAEPASATPQALDDAIQRCERLLMKPDDFGGLNDVSGHYRRLMEGTAQGGPY